MRNANQKQTWLPGKPQEGREEEEGERWMGGRRDVRESRSWMGRHDGSGGVGGWEEEILAGGKRREHRKGRWQVKTGEGGRGKDQINWETGDDRRRQETKGAAGPVRRTFKRVGAFLDCWPPFFPPLTDWTNDLALIWDALFFLKDVLKTWQLAPVLLLCVCMCVSVDWLDFSSKSTMESYTHCTLSLTKVKPLNKCNVLHNYNHVYKMIEKSDSFLNKAFSFMSLLQFL